MVYKHIPRIHNIGLVMYIPFSDFFKYLQMFCLIYQLYILSACPVLLRSANKVYNKGRQQIRQINFGTHGRFGYTTNPCTVLLL